MKVVTIHTREGYRTGLLVTVGPKKIHFITPDASGMRVQKLSKDHQRGMIEQPYNVNKAKRRMRSMCKKFGATKECRRALRG